MFLNLYLCFFSNSFEDSTVIKTDDDKMQSALDLSNKKGSEFQQVASPILMPPPISIPKCQPQVKKVSKPSPLDALRTQCFIKGESRVDASKKGSIDGITVPFPSNNNLTTDKDVYCSNLSRCSLFHY